LLFWSSSIKAHLSLTLDNIADALWTALNKSNQALAKALSSLSAIYERDRVSYTDGVKFISSLRHVQVSLRSEVLLLLMLSNCNWKQWLTSPSIPSKQKQVVDAFHEVHRLSEVSFYLVLVILLIIIAYPGHPRENARNGRAI
jgi:hypothetical protein